MVALLLPQGCGVAKYEERLQATAEFYEYMNLIEANLASPIWERSDLGLKMRLPLPFRIPLPGPELLVDEEGHQEFGPDPRQPAALGIELPGIVEAWQAPLPAESGHMQDARIYLLTNHSRFKKVDGAVLEEPMEFIDDLENQLANLFGVDIPEGETDRPADHIRYSIVAPVPGSAYAKYIQPKRYSVIRFVSDQPINGQVVQVLLYEHRAGDIQTAVLMIGPTTFSSQFRQRIDLALQTLAVTPQISAQMDKATGTARQGGVSGF